MKSIVILLLECVLLVASACSEDYTPKKYMGLKGNIESVRDTVYEFSQLGAFVLDAPGDIYRTIAIDFDHHGNITKQIEYQANNPMPFAISEHSYTNDTLVASHSRLHERDSSYHTISSKYIPGKGKTMKYEENNGTQTWIRQVKTSGKYRCHLSEGDWGYTKEEIWADGKNNIIKHRILTESKELAEVTEDGSGIIEQVVITKYDPDGNEIEDTRIENKDTMICTYSYPRYDDHGNWIEMKTQVNSHFKYITKRTITYAK